MKINLAIGAYSINNEYQVLCKNKDKLPNVTISIGNKPFVLTPDDYVVNVTYAFDFTVCYSGFQITDFPEGFWVFGDSFIGKFYTVRWPSLEDFD